MATAVSLFVCNSPLTSASTRSPHSLREVKKFSSNPLSSGNLLTKQISRSNSIAFGVKNTKSYRNGVRAFFFNPTKEPIVREALEEPIAFLGGMFAGLLRLDLEEEPLKEWVTRSVEAAGVTEDIDVEGSKTEESPQQIEIE